MKTTLTLILALASLSIIRADSTDQMTRNIIGAGAQPNYEPRSIAAHGIIDKDNKVLIKAYNGTLTFQPIPGVSLTLPGASGVLTTSGTTGTYVFEGATADAYETTLAVVDPTADGSVFIANPGAGDADTNTSVMLSTINSGLNAPGLGTAVWSGANSIIFEGTTVDAHEAVLDVADPTADVTVRIPVVAAGTYSPMLSSLASNAPNIASSVTGGTNLLNFEGTADDYEAALTAADATADTTFSLPVAPAGAYGFLTSTLAANGVDATTAVWGAANGIVAEGTTVDASETTLAFADATADTTQTVPAPAVSGTVEVLSVQAEAATDTITAGQLYGGVITNTGAVGAAVYTLPAPVVGMHFRVYLTVAQDVDINPADGTQILALTNATGDAISSAAAIGNCIELIALSTTTWGAFAVSGTWSDAN